MSVPTDPKSYKSDDPALLREIVGSAETRLQAQLTVALAADQRALVLGSFLSAAIVALVSGSVALWISEERQTFLSLIALFCAVGFLIALFLTTYVARPVEWNYPGTRPESWMNDIAESKSEALRLSELCADLQRKTAENAAIMRKNGKAIRWALRIAAASLGFSGLALVCFFLR